MRFLPCSAWNRWLGLKHRLSSPFDDLKNIIIYHNDVVYNIIRLVFDDIYDIINL
jgi:hypothetical protein